MEWNIKVENHPQERIHVVYKPFEDSIIFIGQHKNEKGIWIDLCDETYSSDIDLESIQILILKTFKKLKTRLKTYTNLNEGFSAIKEVGIEINDSKS